MLNKLELYKVCTNFFIFIIIFLGIRVQAETELQIGQLLFIGIQGTKMTPILKKNLLDLKPGGIILFKRNIINPDQIESFNQQIINIFLEQKLEPPFIAIDQEGGGVYRIPTDPLLPSAAALGRISENELLREYGKEIGKILKKLHFTMNFAPVLDIRTSESDFIGTRSYGDKPKDVSQKALLFAKGLLESGVLPTGKHFPGVGGIQIDPHHETPIGNLDWNKSWNKELLPFREFSQLYPSALMLSHVVYPKMDREKKPASLSSNIIEKGLRKKLKYQGLIITDDLLMDGVKKKEDPVSAGIMALKAGADMAMMTWSFSQQKLFLTELENSIRNKKISESVIKTKIDSVLNVKKILFDPNYGRKPAQIPDLDQAFKSEKLETLNSSLLSEIFDNDNKESKALPKELAQLPLFIIDAPQKIQPDILKHRDLKKTEFFQIKKTNDWTQLRNRMSQNKKAYVLFFVKNALMGHNLKWFSDEEKQRIIIINMQAPGIEKNSNYAGYFSPYWSFEKIYTFLENYLNKNLKVNESTALRTHDFNSIVNN